MKLVRHTLYYTVAGITYIPYAVLEVAGQAAEYFFGVMMKFRQWCFSERYVARENLPPRRDKR